MRILDRYIVREVFRHALLGIAVFTFVFFVPKLVQLMELFVRHSGSGAQILELFLCIFPAVLTFTLPMAVLIGVLLGLGRMSADSEIIALTALGIGQFLRFYQRFRKHLHAVELFSGALLLFVGGLVFVNRLTWMAGKLGFLNSIVLWLERSLTGAK